MTATLAGKPLTFGDTDQIMALKEIRRAYSFTEEEEELLEKGELKYYSVTVNIEGSFTSRVLARNADDAKDKVEADYDIADIGDYTDTFVTCNEIKL